MMKGSVKSLFSFRLKKKKSKNSKIRGEPFQQTSDKILEVNIFCEITNTFHVVPFFKNLYSNRSSVQNF